MLYALRSSGYRVSGDLDALAEVGGWISSVLGRRNESRAGKAILARKEREKENMAVRERERDGGNAEAIASNSVDAAQQKRG